MRARNAGVPGRFKNHFFGPIYGEILMFRKTLSVLTAVSQLCLLAAFGGRTASAAAVTLNPGAQQVILSPTNVIGGSGAYDSGNNSAYNDNSQGFAAGNIFSAQTAATISENPPNYQGFWISGDNSPPTAYITIDLGASYDNLSQIEPSFPRFAFSAPSAARPRRRARSR
jgi:hypothetical protein